MKTTLGLLGPLTMAAVGLLIAAPPAVAGDTTCNTGFPGPALPGAHDNVVVPQGGVCVIDNATIKGNVKALEDLRLYISDSSVGGNIEGDKANVVQTLRVTVKYGNIQIKEGGPNSDHYEAAVCQTTLSNGNIQIEKMDVGVGLIVGNPDVNIGFDTPGGDCPGNVLKKGNIKVEENIIAIGPYGFASGLRIRNNTVGGPPTIKGPGGNLQVFKNSGDGDKDVLENTIRQNLQCKENQLPFTSADNLAREFEAQCPQ